MHSSVLLRSDGWHAAHLSVCDSTAQNDESQKNTSSAPTQLSWLYVFEDRFISLSPRFDLVSSYYQVGPDFLDAFCKEAEHVAWCAGVTLP